MSKKSSPQNQNEITNSGFSNNAQRNRAINEKGEFNVKNFGLPFFRSYEIYNHLITMSWRKFSVMVFIGFLIINSFFATIYFLIGANHFPGMDLTSESTKCLDAFFFSAQTLTTVGYGRISPHGFWASSVAAIESLVGLLSFALATGLLYGRFSRPQAKILHSAIALMAPYKITQRGLMFRIANMRRNILNEVEASVTISMMVDETNGPIRRFYPMELEAKMIRFFPLSWTIVHPINEKSPIYAWTKEDLEKADVEILVYLKAYDETFSQNVHTRFSYRHDEIIWGAKFIRNFEINQAGGFTHHYLDRISDFEHATLPELVEKELMS
ncbi:MAG: ion channel [Bacteroidota bacterium]